MKKNNDKIKILFTIPNFDTAGSGFALFQLARILDKKKFIPEIACTSNRGYLYKEIVNSGIKVHVFDLYFSARPIHLMLKNCYKLSKLFKNYKWNSAVTEKGDDARTHTGVIAQEISKAMSDEGLDATKYAFFTKDTWWESTDSKTKEVIKHKFKEDIPKDAIEKERYGVRYPELFSFIFSSIESRLTGLESK